MVVNGIFYVVVGGIQWRMLPKEYPNWKSVYHYFRLWRIDGTSGNGYMTRCAQMCGGKQDGTNIRRRVVWTAKA